MAKKIIFCTLRPNKGATGGPGGVLYLQKTTLGKEINGIPCEYWFNVINFRLGFIGRAINAAIFYVRALFTRDAYFFTHDVISGDILARLGKNYSMIFHHQGPIVEEMTNLGFLKSEKDAKNWARKEKNTFVNAKTLHFPANGAADMYFTSKYANCKREEVNVCPALYNIIPLVDPQKPENFPLQQDNSKLTLFSLGTLTVAKGQDQVVSFLKKHISVFSKPVRYIMVGKGPLKDELLKSLDDIKKDYPSFEYHYFEGVPHDTVMYLHKISDIYIMLHRISIFDFATLEAMSQRSAVILSKVGGNIDFNMDNNIIYAEDVNKDSSILANADIKALQKKNYDVFCDKFSKEAFIKQYKEFFKKILE